MKNQTESLIQQACVKWFRYTHQNIIISSFPNQGARSETNASRMKAEGMCAGMPDIVIFSLGCEKNIHSEITDTYGALFVEFKTEKGTLTPVQKEVHRKLQNSGYKVVVCRSFDEFKQAVENYLD